ncbi:MAG: hypothetical protein KatS3mg056_1935 [Chloroflexus sp.]|nr:MAG: hypothetical protein KatS3mg056_1935 [Chloroflexus sp.]
MYRPGMMWSMLALIGALMLSSVAPLAAAPFSGRTSFADPRFASHLEPYRQRGRARWTHLVLGTRTVVRLRRVLPGKPQCNSHRSVL